MTIEQFTVIRYQLTEKINDYKSIFLHLQFQLRLPLEHRLKVDTTGDEDISDENLQQQMDHINTSLEPLKDALEAFENLYANQHN